MSIPERAASMVAAMQPAQDGVLRGTHAAPAENFSDADLFAAMDDEVAAFAGTTLAPPVQRPAGRPSGSPNRTTLQLQKWLIGRGYRDPAEMLAAIESADARVLAAALAGHHDPSRVTFDQALDVLKLQRAAAGDLLGYFHQRLPQQAEARPDDGAGRTLIVINGAAAVGVSHGQQNQGLSAGVVDVSDAHMSDGEEKS